jgi:3D (Asp-Asp-Asp) domain-containing protein
MSRKGCAVYLLICLAYLVIFAAMAFGIYKLGSAIIEALIPEADAVAVEPLQKGSAAAPEISKRQRAETCILSEKMQKPAAEPSTEDPEDFENEKIEAALIARAHKIENCMITYYCCEKRPHICGTGDGITAAGNEVTPGVSCAAPKGVPLGATVMIDWGDGEIEYRRADDRGDAVRGDHFDLAVPTHAEALELGVKRATVYWCEEAIE